MITPTYLGVPIPEFVHERIMTDRQPFDLRFEFSAICLDDRIKELTEQHPVIQTIPFDEVDGR